MPGVRGRRPRSHGADEAPQPTRVCSWGPHFRTGLAKWPVSQEDMGREADPEPCPGSAGVGTRVAWSTVICRKSPVFSEGSVPLKGVQGRAAVLPKSTGTQDLWEKFPWPIR